VSSAHERRELVERLCARASALSVAERAQFLAQACAGDGALRREVEELLACEHGTADPATVVTVGDLDAGGDSLRDLLERVVAHTPEHSRYRVESEIARGGMGAILRVWDEDLNRPLAMKVALGAGPPVAGAHLPGGDPRLLARFLEEAQVTGQLDHPGIVPVHELGLDSQGRIYFTMKLVKGQTLKEVFDELARGEGGWTQTRVLGLLLKVCEAMAYAHSKGVVHRDLKPANIMVGKYGEVYVMDWGLARVLTKAERHDLRLDLGRSGVDRQAMTATVSTDLTRLRESSPDEDLVTMDGTVVGTPCYMPPEQALSDTSALGPRTDVYSLGAILYHLLSGSLPYVPRGKRVNPHVVFMALIHGAPPPLQQLVPGAPEELVAICEKAMAHDAQQRYSSAVELAEDIQAYLEHRPVSARRHSLREVARLAYERNRPIALTAATGSLLLLIALTLFVWRLQAQVTETRTAYDRLESATLERERIASLLAVRALLAEADSLAVTPAGLGRMRTWIQRVQELLAREEDLRAQGEQLPADSEPGAELRAALERFGDLRQILSRVSGWERTAASLESRLAGGDAAVWAQAREAIARSPRYGGLDLEPQVGLVPLRENPLSELWEFWHVASGERPEVDPDKDDRYQMTPESGIVLVLLPAGDYVMGDDTGRLGYSQTLAVSISPLFIGKYEVTQGQWRRTMGRNDSQFAAGLTLPALFREQSEATPFTAVHPVEFVDWYAAASFCSRLGLVLPRESQWEYACRAGTTSDWCWGDDPASLQGRENVRDQEARKLFGQGEAGFAPWNDGYPAHAPVGSFESNDFGLFDVHGNVSEWCSDRQAPATDTWLAVARERHFYRGGSWHHPVGVWTHAAFRYDRDAREAFGFVGLRTARPLDP